MPLDFSILKPAQSQAQPVMGSAPGVSLPPRQPDQLNEFANGFLNAYSQGQQIRSNNETIKQQEIRTQEMEGKVADAKALKEAAAQGWGQYLDILGKQDPVAKVDAETKMADLQKANANAKQADAESYKTLLGAQATIWGRVAQGRNPEEKQAIYQMSLKDAPDSVKKTMPAVYSDSAMAAGMTIIQYDLADYKSKHPESNEARSGIGKIQDDINKKKQTIEQKKSQGLDTKADEEQLAQLEGAAKTQAEGTNKFQQANVMRDEFNNITKPFREVNDAYGRILASAKEPSAAGDLALVFNYMKMLDPGSTVREGEFATAQNSAGVPDRIRAMYNKTMNGERLAPATRDDFVKRSGVLYKSQEKGYTQVADDYTKRAKRSGLDPADVIVDVRVPGRDVTTKETYTLNGKPFNMEAAMKATGLSKEEIIKQAGLK